MTSFLLSSYIFLDLGAKSKNLMSFLKAAWRKLAIANYEVFSELLQELVPYGTRLDTWQGKNYVSLVGFMFRNTKVLGVKIPFHINFEEVNLRFCVKREENADDYITEYLFLRRLG